MRRLGHPRQVRARRCSTRSWPARPTRPVLANLARGQPAQRSSPRSREALVGRFDAEHALVVGQILAHIDFLEEADRSTLRQRSRSSSSLSRKAVELLMSDPGRETAHRRGADRRDRRRHEHLPDRQTPRFLGRRCAPATTNPPANDAPGKTRQGSKWLRLRPWTEAANAAARAKNTYLSAQYQRLRGSPRPRQSVSPPSSHTILTAAWHMLQTGELYNDLGNDYFSQTRPRTSRQPARATTRKARTQRHAPTPGGRRLTRISLQHRGHAYVASAARRGGLCCVLHGGRVVLPARGGWWRGLGVAGAGGLVARARGCRRGGVEARARGLRELLDTAQASGSIT